MALSVAARRGVPAVTVGLGAEYDVRFSVARGGCFGLRVGSAYFAGPGRSRVSA